MKLSQGIENEHQFIRRCQQGDVQAYAMLYKQYERPLFNTALRMSGNPQDAEDAVQIAFLKLYRSIDKFQFKSKLSTYLYRILMNVCFDQMEKRKREMEKQNIPTESSYSEKPDLKLHLEKAISALPEKMRACFVLFAIEDLKQEEISEILHLKIGTVKAHIFAAKAKLRASFFESLPGELS
ncbi:MAG: RNA polymerase sigma factor [Deferribacteres bacterium]|nr:RNA polymerase sigma factor [candidate division KSB1 bacterium]MCB9500404.1 RNA polymerase sigma factor [Deferribacteres bacterium]